jgi:hypothetical protein
MALKSVSALFFDANPSTQAIYEIEWMVQTVLSIRGKVTLQ